MAILSIPEKGITLTQPQEIRDFFQQRNLYFDQWDCDVVFDDSATQDEILNAYAKDLKPFMEKGGYQTADVISINQTTENYEAIRAKFLAEHTHSEDEIRFFVDGEGLFWFNLDNEPVFNLLCQRGDLISVPAGTKHWFDAGEKNPFVKAIRIFIDTSGWVPEYTDSKKEQQFSEFQVDKSGTVKCVLTDIEGTTTSVKFVYDILFPYFRTNIMRIVNMQDIPAVKEALTQTKELALSEDGERLETVEQCIKKLYQWSEEDRKITPLKTLQGILWDAGYRDGSLQGHVYEDVEPQLKNWHASSKTLAVFSSGSIAAQKLIFGFSTSGDLTPYFSNYFDTTTGGKRDAATYSKIAQVLQIDPHHILFLSDVVEELLAAHYAGFQTIQLVREGTELAWPRSAKSFSDINI